MSVSHLRPLGPPWRLQLPYQPASVLCQKVLSGSERLLGPFAEHTRSAGKSMPPGETLSDGKDSTGMDSSFLAPVEQCWDVFWAVSQQGPARLSLHCLPWWLGHRRTLHCFSPFLVSLPSSFFAFLGIISKWTLPTRSLSQGLLLGEPKLKQHILCSCSVKLWFTNYSQWSSSWWPHTVTQAMTSHSTVDLLEPSFLSLWEVPQESLRDKKGEYEKEIQ